MAVQMHVAHIHRTKAAHIFMKGIKPFLSLDSTRRIILPVITAKCLRPRGSRPDTQKVTWVSMNDGRVILTDEELLVAAGTPQPPQPSASQDSWHMHDSYAQRQSGGKQ